MGEQVRSEAELIGTYLLPLAGEEGLGLSDDTALIPADGHHDLVVTTDPVRAGVHFFGDEHPGDIAWKALAVNVSDLVAKGAEPFAYTMALAFPSPPERQWMSAFVAGLKEAQTVFGCRLIGGDTDHGGCALSVAITAFGRVPKGQMVRRLTARTGDRVFVSGTIGDAALGLMLRRDALVFGDALPQNVHRALIDRYLRPQPVPALAEVVRACASAALDISDGLVRDAGKLAAGGSCRLELKFESIPLSHWARQVVERFELARQAVVSGGDDYAVLMAVPPERVSKLLAMAAKLQLPIAEIGVLVEGEGVVVLDADGLEMELVRAGYDHFGGS